MNLASICKFCGEEIEWEQVDGKWKPIHFTPKQKRPIRKCKGLGKIKQQAWREANRDSFIAAKRLGASLDRGFDAAIDSDRDRPKEEWIDLGV